MVPESVSLACALMVLSFSGGETHGVPLVKPELGASFHWMGVDPAPAGFLLRSGYNRQKGKGKVAAYDLYIQNV